MGTVVLWPADLATCEGTFYGWTRPLTCVVGVIPGSYINAGAILESAVVHSQWRGVRHMFSGDPTILGRCFVTRRAPPTLSFSDSRINLGSVQLVYYQRHKRQSMRFYSFNFSELDILPSQEAQKTLPVPSTDVHERSLKADFTRQTPRRGSALDGEVLSQVNLAHLFADIVDRQLGSAKLAPSSSLPGTPDLNRPGGRAADLRTSEKRTAASATIKRGAETFYTLSRMVSTTAEQFDVRYEQGVYVFGEVPYVYNDKARTVQSISKYIKFHNCVWLVLNDVIIGVAFGSFLCDNRFVFARWLHYGLETYLVDGMQRALLWLNNWPAGLKLNTELSQFYCHSLIGVVSVWGWLLGHAAPYFPALIWLIGVGGCCGMTVIVSLLSDTLSVLTVHLYICYYISATVFKQQLSLAGSLWNLFRGKRYNVLRNRIDTWDYDLDQLLLGTILFTLLAFLYPTVLTYYALSATARLAVIICHAMFDTVTALLNHFPLFALLLRVKDPLRLPGGVCIQTSRTGSLTLASQPAPLSSIFRHYAHLAGRLSTHYHPLRMLRQLASGRLLSPIPRASIRYSMIPTEPGHKGKDYSGR
ncbi:Gpi1-domain-containing protein [Lentinus tigrinus ALCF2SS1-7]|uniref:Gpi1-domain-containing protein n=1 Tax=Lentinus tigrinus ALCF2SS1-6 TaxID=1328759 RepID=A0A5C2SE91_9APHY|nr:Gpi1-domain-containing protein [Lentinus tigrinus ALCF2SS1-6]RPD76188.1 Gpi1-domain-containing protein [Lentinus tigrinus ALCF2SS1-7]